MRTVEEVKHKIDEFVGDDSSQRLDKLQSQIKLLKWVLGE